MPHKSCLGQLVKYVGAPFGARVTDVNFTIVRLLPKKEYRIKAKHELNERVAREYELRPVDTDRRL
jgi:hypothetical protein